MKNQTLIYAKKIRSGMDKFPYFPIDQILFAKRPKGRIYKKVEEVCRLSGGRVKGIPFIELCI
jgi:hypothetical protein